MLTHRLISPCLALYCSSIIVSLTLTPPPRPPSFWRAGSSEVVAVCIAKGNVSSTHRKMGQNIRTLPAHAQCWVDTPCWGHVRVNHITLYPLPYVNVPTSHSCLFSLIIDGAQQLSARFTTTAIRTEQCGGLDMEKIEEEGILLIVRLCSSWNKERYFRFIYVPLWLISILFFISSRHLTQNHFPTDSSWSWGGNIR